MLLFRISNLNDIQVPLEKLTESVEFWKPVQTRPRVDTLHTKWRITQSQLFIFHWPVKLNFIIFRVVNLSKFSRCDVAVRTQTNEPLDVYESFSILCIRSQYDGNNHSFMQILISNLSFPIIFSIVLHNKLLSRPKQTSCVNVFIRGNYSRKMIHSTISVAFSDFRLPMRCIFHLK